MKKSTASRLAMPFHLPENALAPGRFSMTVMGAIKRKWELRNVGARKQCGKWNTHPALATNELWSGQWESRPGPKLGMLPRIFE
jgi:hypothetical protein